MHMTYWWLVGNKGIYDTKMIQGYNFPIFHTNLQILQRSVYGYMINLYKNSLNGNVLVWLAFWRGGDASDKAYNFDGVRRGTLIMRNSPISVMNDLALQWALFQCAKTGRGGERG